MRVDPLLAVRAPPRGRRRPGDRRPSDGAIRDDPSGPSPRRRLRPVIAATRALVSTSIKSSAPDLDAALARDFDGPLVSRVGVAEHTHRGVAGQHRSSRIAASWVPSATIT